MGRRSRKRAAPGEHRPAAAAQAEVDPRRARRARAAEERGARSARRRSASERPPPPWGSFPLIELLVLIALVLLIGGFLSHRALMIVAGLGIGSLAGLELSIREHFTGFRSHSTLLAGAVAGVALAATYFAMRGSGARFVMLPVAGFIFILAFWLFRQAFIRRSGGASRR